MRDFLVFLSDRKIKHQLLCYGGAAIAVYIIFVILYPLPFVFPDSGSYMLSAYDPDQFNIYRPMGYSGYISFLHGIWGSMGFLTAVTYFLHIISALFLLFSARYLLKLKGGLGFVMLSVCALFAPTLLFATNFIMSDSLFTSLTMLFLATALWIVFSRNWVVIVVHLLIFWGLYSVRFSGMFYVPISIIAMLFSPLGRNVYIRASLALAPMVLFVALFYSTKSEYKQQTGFDTFSGFNGWQLLNNASVLIPKAASVSPEKFSNQDDIRFMHSFFATYPDSMYAENFMLSTSQMWTKTLPPRQFTAVMMENSKGASYSQAWIYSGVMFQKYATELIKNDFSGYLTKYILPSALSIFKPQSIGEQSNVFKNEPMYANYYGVNFEQYTHQNQGLWSFFNTIRWWLNPIYWVLALGGILYFLVFDLKSIFKKPQSSALLIIATFVVIYICSSIVASPCTSWRYALPIFTPSLLLALYAAQSIGGRLSFRRG